MHASPFFYLNISMTHSNQTITRTCLLGISPGKRPNQTIIKLRVVSLIAMQQTRLLQIKEFWQWDRYR